MSDTLRVGWAIFLGALLFVPFLWRITNAVERASRALERIAAHGDAAQRIAR